MSDTGLRERKKAKTRLALEDAALELFATKGFDATTVDEIAAACDVSRRTFFRYYASKEEVFSGGSSGSPQALWENSAKRAEIQAVLDGGEQPSLLGRLDNLGRQGGCAGIARLHLVQRTVEVGGEAA